MFRLIRVSTEVLIEKLKKNKPEGFEVTVRFGIMTVTRALYLHKGLYYVFEMEDDFIFRENEGYSEELFLKEYLKYFWEIEITID